MQTVFQMREIYGRVQGKMMAKLWLVNWTPAVLPLPVLEPSLRPHSPLFHATHQLESAVGNWAVVFFFFYRRKTRCVQCLRGESLLPTKMNSSMLQHHAQLTNYIAPVPLASSSLWLKVSITLFTRLWEKTVEEKYKLSNGQREERKREERLGGIMLSIPSSTH